MLTTGSLSVHPADHLPTNVGNPDEFTVGQLAELVLELTGAAGPVVFLGDSLTEAGRWAEYFADLEVVNAGRSGDTTADVQDRLGEVVQQHPAAVVVMVGTNDFGLRATVEQVVRGTENILWTLHHELPDARIVVVSVLPRERERAEWIRQVNIHVRQFAPSVKAGLRRG